MTAHVSPRQCRILEESSFTQEGINWAASGISIFVIDPDISGLQRAVLPNENIRPRWAATHKPQHGLKKSDFSMGTYMHGSPDNAAPAAAAVITNYPMAILIKNALGGRDLGWSAAFTGGSDIAPEIAADPGFAIGDYIWAKEDATGFGQFYRILNIAALVLTLDRPLHFTPGASDVAHAVIDFYLHQSAVTQHTHADHETLAAVFVGEETDDAFEVLGCKLGLTINPMNPGEQSRFAWAGLCTTHNLIAKPTITGTPFGEAATVTSIAEETLTLYSDAAGELAYLRTRGTITPNVGITYERIDEVGGEWGVGGHVASGIENMGIELQVPFTDQWQTDFDAHTEKQILIQVGTLLESMPWAIHFPQLVFSASPTRIDEASLTGHKLAFMARENQASPGALAGDNLMKWYSPIHILVVA